MDVSSGLLDAPPANEKTPCFFVPAWICKMDIMKSGPKKRGSEDTYS